MPRLMSPLWQNTTLNETSLRPLGDLGRGGRIMKRSIMNNMTMVLVIGFSMLILFSSNVMGQTTEDETTYSFLYAFGRVMWLFFIALAIWVYRDAEDKVGRNGTIRKASPAVWAICVFFIWIIFFPWYLMVRNDKSKYYGHSSKGKKGRRWISEPPEISTYC